MTRRTAVLAALAIALALTGCGSASTKSASTGAGATTATSASTSVVAGPPAATGSVIAASSGSSSGTLSATSAASAGGGCAGFTPGQNGVIQTFCDGKASAVVTVSSVTTKFSGGECAQSGGYFTINIGVVTSSTFTGAKPNYLGADLPDAVGAFAKTAFPANFGGVAHLITAAGTIASGFSGLTAIGADLTGGSASITVTC